LTNPVDLGRLGHYSLRRASGHDHERIVSKRSLKLERFLGRCAHPHVDLFGRL
jgi:hypothetical protein